MYLHSTPPPGRWRTDRSPQECRKQARKPPLRSRPTSRKRIEGIKGRRTPPGGSPVECGTGGSRSARCSRPRIPTGKSHPEGNSPPRRKGWAGPSRRRKRLQFGAQCLWQRIAWCRLLERTLARALARARARARAPRAPTRARAPRALVRARARAPRAAARARAQAPRVPPQVRQLPVPAPHSPACRGSTICPCHPNLSGMRLSLRSRPLPDPKPRDRPPRRCRRSQGWGRAPPPTPGFPRSKPPGRPSGVPAYQR